MHYVEAGAGQPVVFLHGNPTSSLLWRDVLPAVHCPGRRLIAVDLVGMGASGKPAIDYRLTDHIDHVTAFLDALGLSDSIFVAHDWGVAICLEYLRCRPERVAAVAFMEGHLRPLDGWDASSATGPARSTSGHPAQGLHPPQRPGRAASAPRCSRRKFGSAIGPS
jgi:haloalkane dehalogenase